MTSAELNTVDRGNRRGVRALEAQRMIDLIALRLAPSLAAGLIAYSHMGQIGEGLIVFTCVLIATQAIVRSQLPLHVMPASRVLLGLAAPLVGAGGAWLVALAAGESYPFSEYEAVVLGAWLVMALGAWIKARFGAGLRARVAVIGPREFASDFVAELEAANVRTYDVVGWISPSGPAEYRRMRWLGTLDEVRESVIAENIDLLVCGPGAGEAEGARIEDICARVADDCLDLPVRLIAANQLYEEIFGHVPVGMIDAAWYRYIMHPRFRAVGPVFEADLRPRARHRDRARLPAGRWRSRRSRSSSPTAARCSIASSASASTARRLRSSSCAPCAPTPRPTGRSGRRSATTA